MANGRYIAITGGVGGAKLGLGLSRCLSADELIFVVNTGDDFEHLGLKICPDIDTLIYTLSGEANRETGWGRTGETWQFMSALDQLGGETWFNLGDKDLALHVERTRRLGEGLPLTQVTAQLAANLGVEHTILPMTDETVSTIVHTPDGPLAFQHYFVRDRCEPAVRGFAFEGAADANPNEALLAQLDDPELTGVIFCPSNPFVSIDPILATGDLRARLTDIEAPVVAVSPIIGGHAIKGPTAKMMKELDIPNSTVEVAQHYIDFLDGFIIDATDAELEGDVVALGLETVVTQTVMVTLDDRIALARESIALIDALTI
jgi:LPPG:FO 2-phospho-L-lactate transferase